jgi:hypothetical protein
LISRKSGRSSTLVLAIALALAPRVASADEIDSEPPFAPQRLTLDSAGRDRLERDLSRMLGEPEFAYCRDPRQAARVLGADLCRLASAEARQRCPAVAQACAGGVPRVSPEEREARSDQTRVPVPSRAFGNILFWFVMTLLAALLVRLLWPLLSSLAPAPEAAAQASESNAPPGDVRAPRAPRESDVERLLAQAERARKEERFEQAIGAIYGALVHFLGREQLITVESARTNGDYLRELAREPGLQTSVRSVFRAVERVQFGRSHATAELCAELWGLVLPIVKRGATILGLLAAAHSLTACRQGPSAVPERDPNGLELVTKLLQENGTRVRRLVHGGEDAKFDDDIARILVLGRDVSPEAWDMALNWTVMGGSLVVTEPSEQLLHLLGIELEVAAPCAHALELTPRRDGETFGVISAGTGYLRLPHDADTDDPQSVHVEASCDGKVKIATLRYGAGEVTLVPDRQLFGNVSLSVADNAAFAVGMLGTREGSLGLVGGWTGSGAATPFRALHNAGLGLSLLELLALLGVLLWHRGAAFGTRRDPDVPARRAFADHVRALGRNYARAGARRHVLAQYSAYTLELLRERFGRGAAISLIDLAGEVARRSDRSEAEVMNLLAEAHEAAQEASHARGTAGDIQTIDRLESLLHPGGGTQ